MILITIITLYPVWFSLINSLNSAGAIAKHGYAMLIPDEFSTASWQAVLKNNEIVKAFFGNTGKNNYCHSRTDSDNIYVCLWILQKLLVR